MELNTTRSSLGRTLAAPGLGLSAARTALTATAAVDRDMPGMRLAELPKGQPARVVSVAADTVDCPGLGRRLAELGFLPGEKLRIVARGLMGREPLAVRIGTGTFALRLFEAECIRVSVERPLRA